MTRNAIEGISSDAPSRVFRYNAKFGWNCRVTLTGNRWQCNLQRNLLLGITGKKLHAWHGENRGMALQARQKIRRTVGEQRMGVMFSCSLDDGHPSDMKAVELLCKRGVNATFYIPIKNREGRQVLPAGAIRQIASEFEIGSHTYDHCFLKDLQIKDAQYQVIEGKKRLEDMLGKQVAGFCYPGGKYRPEHADLVRSAGFQYARTTMNLRFDSGDLPFEMPTTFQFYPHDRNVYLRNFAKGGQWLKRHEGLRLALKHENWIDRLYALFEHSSDHGDVFHLWGHSKDIDELDAWQEFDRFLAHVATNVAPKDRLTNEQLATRHFLSTASA